MRVFVVGHRGMLGHVVTRYLTENECEVVTSERRYAALPRDPLVEEIRDSNCSWVVNALGKIKQKCQDDSTLFAANTLFPLHVKKRLRPGQQLIHASTDCVFSGKEGGYAVDDAPNPEDEYGLSKLLGESVAEPNRACVVRTSIIGPEQSGHAGLMAWFLRQQGEVRGYRNHLWNGITTLEWAKVCLDIIRGQQPGSGALWHVGVWPPVSKYDLLSMIARAWDHPIAITPHDAADTVDRSLQPTWTRPGLPTQLAEFKDWYSMQPEPAPGTQR